MPELDDESKIFLKLLLIKEMCSWLPAGLDMDGKFTAKYEYVYESTNKLEQMLNSRPTLTMHWWDTFNSVI